MYVRELLAGLFSPVIVAWPSRFHSTLTRFSLTELYTAFDIRAGSDAVDDAKLKSRMQRHAAEELSHFRTFARWAGELRPYVQANFADPAEIQEQTRQEVETSSKEEFAPHRRFRDTFSYMLFLTISESRAWLLFVVVCLINSYDRRCRKYLPQIIRDEGGHCVYTFKRALRLGVRSPFTSFARACRVVAVILVQDVTHMLEWLGKAMSWVMSTVLYFVIVTPYGLLLRVTGSVRRARLRRAPAARPAELDERFWSAP